MRVFSIFLTIILGANARGFSAAQNAQEVQQRFAQLRDATTSDEASVQLKTLVGSNADARLYLAKGIAGAHLNDLTRSFARQGLAQLRSLGWRTQNRGNHSCPGEVVRPCQI